MITIDFVALIKNTKVPLVAVHKLRRVVKNHDFLTDCLFWWLSLLKGVQNRDFLTCLSDYFVDVVYERPLSDFASFQPANLFTWIDWGNLWIVQNWTCSNKCAWWDLFKSWVGLLAAILFWIISLKNFKWQRMKSTFWPNKSILIMVYGYNTLRIRVP